MNQYINSREQDVPIQPPYRPCDPKGPSRSVNGAIPGTGAKAKATAPVVLASSRSVLLENKRYDGGQDGLGVAVQGVQGGPSMWAAQPAVEIAQRVGVDQHTGCWNMGSGAIGNVFSVRCALQGGVAYKRRYTHTHTHTHTHLSLIHISEPTRPY